MPWEKAWTIAYLIEQKGKLDASVLASMEEPELQRLLESLSIRPRYGCVRGARTLKDAASLVMEFGGDAARIWKDATPKQVETRLVDGIYGIGQGIAAMTVRILRDDWEEFRGQEHEIDVKPDVHVMRVFRRTGLTPTESENTTVEVARKLNPIFPGELDWPAWEIGRRWCFATNPDCGSCPLTAVCPTSYSRRRPRRVMPPGILRLVRENDADQIAAIYAPYANDTPISFADRAPTAEEYRERIRRTTDRLPWLVCERRGGVAGYAYASPHRTSPAYKWSVETSIYVHPEHQRTGVGRALYAALLEALRLLGYHRALAGVTDPNPASVGLHEAVGFERFATFDEVGYKRGAWQSVIWLVYRLGNNDYPPTEPRLLPDVLGTPQWDAALAAGQSLLS